MTIELGQDAVDLGILVTDSESALGFYRDLIGMTHEGDMPMPIGGGGTMHRLRCGNSLIKLIKLDDVPEARPAGGGIAGGTGYRYLTLHAKNVVEMVAACEEAGVKVIVPVSEIRPGVTIAMVTDPDGNVVEFVDYGS